MTVIRYECAMSRYLAVAGLAFALVVVIGVCLARFAAVVL